MRYASEKPTDQVDIALWIDEGLVSWDTKTVPYPCARVTGCDGGEPVTCGRDVVYVTVYRGQLVERYCIECERSIEYALTAI